MKFNVSGKSLQQQLSAVSKVINSKNTLNILDNFLFTVEGDTLTITGSDQENVMTASLEIMEVEGEGSIAISASMLIDIFKEVSNQALTFYINEETLEIDIKFHNGHFNFKGVNGAEYPSKITPEAESKTIKVSATVVQKGIENTIFAVSSDTIRPVMTGIYWDIHEKDITFVSSDTHKLVKYVNENCTPGLEASFIMPAKPASIIRSIVGKEEEEMEIVMDSKSATFKFSSYTLQCKFIRGNYPNYNRVIPENNPFIMTIDRVTLLKAMRRVSLFASAASSLVKMNIQPNEVLLSSQDMDYATSAEERVACEYNGNTMTIGFNAKFMIEVLNNLKSDNVILKLSDPTLPGIFCPIDEPEKEKTIVLLMPMQVMD